MKHIIDFDDLLTEVTAQARPHFGKGRPAHYIPELAQVDPNQFGMALCMLKRNEKGRILGDDYAEYGVGDCDTDFSAQSLTKLFALGLALNRRGDEVWMRVGKEPSGTPFNYLSQLEQEEGAPRNPFINAGALAITDMLLDVVREPDNLVRDFMGFLGAAELKIDEAVAASELETAYKNRALANLMRSFGTIHHDVDTVIEAYCRQCAITINCRQLARAGLSLAASGFSPVVSESVFAPRLTRRLNALLLTCGIYDSVGSFAYRVGLPAKSGVGGGIIAIIPGQGALCVWSPELDRFGTSVVGAYALEAFAHLSDCSVL
jgi:glutaminase